MTIEGEGADGAPLTRRHFIIARSGHGPYIPCIPVIAIAKAMAAGCTFEAGARPCLGIVSLAEFRAAFTPAQGPLGQTLCHHYGIDWNATYVFVRDGRAFTRSDGYFEVAKVLGGWWRLTLVFRIVPRPLRDWVYDLIAKNRYRWFGTTTEACQLLTHDQRARLI